MLRVRDRGVADAQNLTPGSEFGTEEWFCEVVSEFIVGFHVPYVDLFLFELLTDVVGLNVDVLVSAEVADVAGPRNCTCIVFVEESVARLSELQFGAKVAEPADVARQCCVTR